MQNLPNSKALTKQISEDWPMQNLGNYKALIKQISGDMHQVLMQNLPTRKPGNLDPSRKPKWKISNLKMFYTIFYTVTYQSD